MWFMTLLSYFVVSYVDTRAYTRLKEKGIMPLYIILMVISCIISISANYVRNMPSPSKAIENLVMFIIGK